MPWPSDLELSVLHGVRPGDMAAAVKAPARPVLNSPEQVARWRETGRPCDVMVDTGMNRLGPDAAGGALGPARRPADRDADEPSRLRRRARPSNERAPARALPDAAGRTSRRRATASPIRAGICLGPEYAFGLTRPGLALYGGIPVAGDSAQGTAIRPVASIEAQIVQVRDVPAGASIGYGANLRRRLRTCESAILNIGYADGYLRVLGERRAMPWPATGFAPVVGRISMDLLAVEIPQAGIVKRIQLAGGKAETASWRSRRGLRRGGLAHHELPAARPRGTAQPI